MTEPSRDTNPRGPQTAEDEAALEELRRLSAKFLTMDADLSQD